ncbi:MAG: hypothetical protein WA213_16890 [Terriglobales bacterium]
MTVGIGLLATTLGGRDKKVVPDTAILIADTMGSFGDVDSHDRLHKAFMFPEVGLYAVAADQIDRAGEVLSAIKDALATLPKDRRTHGEITRTVAAVCYGYKRGKFTTHEFPKLRLPPTELDPTMVTPHLNAIVQEKWEQFSIGCDLILAVFCNTKAPTLLRVSGVEHEIENVVIPGFAVIGIGEENARFWLSRRQQQFGQQPLRAAYHAYEAKVMAEASAHVNEHLDIVVATDDDHWFCTSHAAVPRYKVHPEINVKNLKRLYRRYGPHETSGLDVKL